MAALPENAPVGDPSAFPPQPPAAVVNMKDVFNKTVMLETTWTDSHTHCIGPATSIDQKRLTFNLDKLEANTFSYLGEMRLRLTVELVNARGEPPADNLTVAPVVNFPAAMINSCRVALSSVGVSGGGNEGLYPYWNFINNFTSFSSDRRGGVGELFGDSREDDALYGKCLPGTSFFERRGLFGVYRGGDAISKATLRERAVRLLADTPEIVEADVRTANDRRNYERREALTYYLEALNDTSPSRFRYLPGKVDIYCNLLNEFSSCREPMLARTGGTVDILLNKPGFYLECEKQDVRTCREQGYYLKISAAELQIPCKKMQIAKALEIEEALKKEPIVYQTTRIDMRKILIPKGVKRFVTQELKTGAATPDRMILFLCPCHVFDDDYGHSPFYMPSKIAASDTSGDPFTYFKITGGSAEEEANTNVAVESVVLSQDRLNFETSESTGTHRATVRRKLLELLDNMGRSGSETCPAIKLATYQSHRFIMLYDLTDARRAAWSGSVRQTTKEGPLKLEVNFSGNLPCNAYLFAFSDYHNQVAVDKNRSVTYRSLA